ncbi:MAG TPA: hypothetical protein VH678_16975 [Xanthobacteraceae bacterium]|jgi:hypothetical protein
MTFNLDFLKAILGLLSIVGGTASGIAVLLVDYKDKKTGQITKWGRYALFGIGISFLIGASNLWIDYVQKSRETRNAAERARENSEKTLQIVTDISRNLNPFKDVRVGFAFSYPFDHPDLAKYRDRLDTGVRALLPGIQKSNREIEGVSWVRMTKDVIDIVRLRNDSPLFPREDDESLAFQVFLRRGLSLYFFKMPINPSAYDLRSSFSPDINMDFNATSGFDQEIEVHYHLQTKTIEFVAYSILSKPESWQSSGKIVSSIDLPETQLIVQLEYDENATALAKQRQPLQRIDLPHTMSVDMTIGDRRTWDMEEFEQHKGPRGTTNFVYSFPRSYPEEE